MGSCREEHVDNDIAILQHEQLVIWALRFRKLPIALLMLRVEVGQRVRFSFAPNESVTEIAALCLKRETNCSAVPGEWGSRALLVCQDSLLSFQMLRVKSLRSRKQRPIYSSGGEGTDDNMLVFEC